MANKKKRTHTKKNEINKKIKQIKQKKLEKIFSGLPGLLISAG